MAYPRKPKRKAKKQASKKKARKQARRKRRPNYRKTLLDCQREFLTPTAWKACHQAAPTFQARRWKLMPLLMVGMLMLFLTAPCRGERFEEARQLWTAMMPNRRRVGQTLSGFLDALERVPRSAVRAMYPQIRRQTRELVKEDWEVHGWTPFGVDGSRKDLPRCAKLERAFGIDGKGNNPQMWITSLVHLKTGVPWAWRFGRQDASERHHFLQLLDTLPERSLVVADAGFTGYDVWAELDRREVCFLIRLSSLVTLYADFEVREDFQQGIVYLWLKTKPHQKPLKLRLIRLQGKKDEQGRKQDVWLATNVLDPAQLSHRMASDFFRMRWEQEVFYRTYKCTLKQAKLSSRSVRQVTREAELAMLATQLLLAQATWATQRAGSPTRASATKALRQIRREFRDVGKRGLREGYLKRLGRAVREHRPHRTSSKQHRSWPRKRPHKLPGPPKIIRLTAELKFRFEQELGAAQAA